MATLILLTAISILTLNMFLPSLAHMADDFGVDYALVNLTVAGYLAVTSVLQLIFGPLSDRYGRRPVLLVGLVLFCLASLGCLLAQDFWWFLTFRVLQGAVISGSVLSRAVVRDIAPPQQAASILGYIAMVMAIAPFLGPSFGGLLDQWFGWRASFLAFSFMGVGLLALVWVDLGETNLTPSETFTKQFLAYPELIRSRRFWGYSLCLAFSVGAFYSFLGGAALVSTTEFDLTTAQLGLGMGSITGGFAFGNFLSGRLSTRFSLTTMMIIGRLTACAGLLAGLLFVLIGVVEVPTYFGAVVLVGMGNGLTLPAANAGSMSVRPRLAGSASGLSGALMMAGGAALTSLAGTLLSPGNAAWLLLVIMLISSFAGLLAALYVRRIDLHEGAPY
ncbi:multidrug effflux MFS transporter [Shimia gijangensis]|nr:multidrug effflux MFS transporter [Shimia gijangensis]